MRNVSVVCVKCKKREKYPQTDMHIELVGKNNQKKKYWHFDCWEESKVEVESNSEFLKKELNELDDLYTTIKEIHGLTNVPNAFFVYLQNLRNGTIKIKNEKKKKYKEGVPYPVIKKAYEMNKKKIAWAKSNKKFKHTLAELMYGFKIIESRVNDAMKEMNRLQKEKDMYVNPNHSYSEFNIEPAKKFPKS